MATEVSIHIKGGKKGGYVIENYRNTDMITAKTKEELMKELNKII